MIIKNKNILYIYFILTSQFAYTQVGIGTSTPQGALEVNSGPGQNNGLVLPNVTKVEDVKNTYNINTIVATGTIVYDISRDAICSRHKYNWKCNLLDGQTEIIVSTPDYNQSESTYIKASNTKQFDTSSEEDFFGYSISLSNDGNTLAVGAIGESSTSNSINGDQTNLGSRLSGAVYIYYRSNNEWIQQAYIKASNNQRESTFGNSVSLSNDGNILAVGAYQEDSEFSNSGAVYIYSRNNNEWIQKDHLIAEDPKENDYFGYKISLSGDGNILAVLSASENLDTTLMPGKAHLYIKNNESWNINQTVKLIKNQPNVRDYTKEYIHDIVLSNDGSTIALSVVFDSSNSTGVNANPNNSDLERAGAVYIYSRNNNSWGKQAYLKGSTVREDDLFGISIALSGNGNTLAVGTMGDQHTDHLLKREGEVYIFNRTGTEWNQESYLKASNASGEHLFGNSLSLSYSGDTLAVGAYGENSNAIGINGNQNIKALSNAGAVYIFNRNRNIWSQKTYIKASNTHEDAFFGLNVNLSGNGDTLAVGAYGEASNATGINGNQNNRNYPYAGAVYMYYGQL